MFSFDRNVVTPHFSNLVICFGIQDYVHQNATQIITELCGFVTILCGTFLLHKTKDMGNNPSIPLPVIVPTTDMDCKQESKTTKVTVEV